MAVQKLDLGELARMLCNAQQRVVTAESCTGGLVASTLTHVPGSSEWFEGGFVTYTLHAKTAMLGIASAILQQHGAVSETVAKLMAEHALDRSLADYSIAVTGLAGPGGDGSATAVGTVWLGLASRRPHRVFSIPHHFAGTREQVREAAVHAAIDALFDLCRTGT